MGNQNEIRNLREEISQLRSQLSSRVVSPPPPPVPSPPVVNNLPPTHLPHHGSSSTCCCSVGNPLFIADVVGAPLLWFPRVLWDFVKPTAPISGVQLIPRFLAAANAVLGDALPVFPVLVRMVFVNHTAQTFDAHCIEDVSRCVPQWVAQQIQTQDVLLVPAVHIALTLHVGQLEQVPARHFVCAESHPVPRRFILSTTLDVARFIVRVPVVRFTRPQTGWGQ